MDDSEALATIDEIRELIDKTDETLLKVIATRFRGIQSLRKLKKLKRLPITDKKREQELKELWKKRAKKLGLREEFALLILDFILHESKHIQSS